MKRTVTDPEELRALAREILEHFSKKDNSGALIIRLSGELGAGKTTFSQAIAKELGVLDTVASPTFVIEKIYEIPDNGHYTHLVHIDAYRLESGDELRTFGWDSIAADKHNIILVEWPEKVADIFEKKSPQISFKHINNTTREISWE